MKNDADKQPAAPPLRRRAEDHLKEKQLEMGPSPDDIELKKLVHELQVQQIELEMQNEELRWVQQELYASRARYHELYDLAPVGYCTIDDSGLILEGNLTTASLLNVSRNMIVNQLFPNFIVPAYRDVYYQHRTQLLKTGARQTCCLQMVKKDGKAFWARLESVAVRNEAGVAVCRTIISDVTELKETENELSESKNQAGFEKLLADISTRFIHVSPDELDLWIEGAQQQLCQYLGMDVSTFWQLSVEPQERLLMTHIYAPPGFPTMPENVDGKDYFPWVVGKIIKGERVILSQTKDAPAGAADALRIWRRHGVKSAFHFPLAAGDRVLGMLTFNTVREENQWPEDLISRLEIVADIFAAALNRRRMDLALRNSETRLKDIIFSIADWVWETNEKSVYVYSSSKGEMLFGDVIGKTPFDFMPPDEAVRIAAINSDIAANKAPIKDLENWGITKNGERICFLTNGVPILDEKRNLKGYRGVNKDITDQKQNRLQLEEQLSFQTLLTEISASFISLPIDRIDGKIEDAQRRVCEFLGFDFSSLWQWPPESPGLFSLTHVYRRIAGPPIPNPMYAHEYYPWALQQVEAGRIVVISSPEDYPAEATRDKETRRLLGVKSTLTFPMSAGKGRPFGALSFGTVLKECSWPEVLIARLQLISQTFINALVRKQNETALRESEARLSLVLEAVDAGLWIVDLNTDNIWLTTKGRDLFNLPLSEEVSYKRFLEMIHPEDREPFLQKARNAIQSGGNFQHDFRIILPDGNACWRSTRAMILLNSTGEPQRMLGMSLDITERKGMEEEVRMASQEWQTTFDSIPDSTMILDQDCRVIRANTAVSSFLDLSMDGIIGQHFNVLTHGMGHPWDSPFEEARRPKSHVETEVYDEIRHIWFRLSVDPIFDDKGEIVRVVHTMKDITGQKNREIESFAARNAMGHADRLLQMGELTASLAHELNQPLTSILTNSRAALRFIKSNKLDPTELTEILQDIVDDDKRAGNIIRSLRSMVKPQESEREIVSIDNIVQEVIALFHSEAIIRKIKVEAVLGDSLPSVNVDKVQAQQVLMNLMMNAADSMSDLSKIRTIIIRTAKASNGGVLVAVRDFGPGIAESELSRIFEPFFTTKHSGLGMGLSLSRSIIENHGGHIWAENNTDGGTTFFFDLPAGSRE